METIACFQKNLNCSFLLIPLSITEPSANSEDQKLNGLENLQSNLCENFPEQKWHYKCRYCLFQVHPFTSARAIHVLSWGQNSSVLWIHL